MRRLMGLFSLLFLLVPGLALAQVPTYTLVDLGSANVTNGTGWPAADCKPPALSGSGIQYDSAAYSANEWGETVGESLIQLNAGGSSDRCPSVPTTRTTTCCFGRVQRIVARRTEVLVTVSP